MERKRGSNIISLGVWEFLWMAEEEGEDDGLGKDNEMKSDDWMLHLLANSCDM